MHPSGLVQGTVNTDKCSGSFFLLGGHVAEFQPRSQSQSILFMSNEAVFEVGKPIRGGIPSQRMSDFGDSEFERMCCVETANVAPHQWGMAAGQSQSVGFEISASSASSV